MCKVELIKKETCGNGSYLKLISFYGQREVLLARLLVFASVVVFLK
jgi:hypothetical protein